MNKKLMAHSILASVMVGTIVLPAYADRVTTSEEGSPHVQMAKTMQLEASDRQMLLELEQGNRAEIEAAKLAVKKSKSAEVVTFAKRMNADHTAALGKIEQLAKKKETSLTGKTDSIHESKLKSLDEMSGAEFDRLYLAKAGHEDHQSTLRLLKKIQSNANDADLKMLAEEMEPVVTAHLRTLASMEKN